jgi:ubiquinone/menaquinone biosynthesis C-methylase UbiE
MKRELDFLESIFRAHATFQVNDILDVACGNGRHIIGLARRGYRCVGSDYTPERVDVAKSRARSEHVSLKLSQGDATKLAYENECARAIFEGKSLHVAYQQIHFYKLVSSKFLTV